MNYLAHLFLCEDTDEGRIGSLLADFTVGTIKDLEARFGEAISRSIRHHREVDRFTDTHPAVIHSVEALGQAYGLYSGIVLDVVFDHFLLRHWDSFSSKKKEAFYDVSYGSLARDDWDFPERYQTVVQRLVERRWLNMYYELDNFKIALARIGERFDRETPLNGDIQGIRDNYSLIEKDFLSFFPQLMVFSDRVHSSRK